MINLVDRLKGIENFKPNSFLDIGAHFGEYSKMINDIWPDIDIFMIEANPIKESYLKNTGYKYIISLLTDKIGEIYDFFTNKNDQTSTGCSIYRENTHYFSDENVEITKLTSNTLDNLFFDQKFDLIKLDTQGSEIDILKGGLKLASKCQYIIIETSLVNYNLNAPLVDDVLNFMTSINYKMIDIIELHYINNNLIQIDILFRNINYLDDLKYANSNEKETILNFLKNNK
jgi:FkbM family methyltransferase